MFQTALTLALCAAVGLLLYRKRVPAGMLIGAAAASAVLAAGFHFGGVPPISKHIAQVAAGGFLRPFPPPGGFPPLENLF